jgi:hypothetical protein
MQPIVVNSRQITRPWQSFLVLFVVDYKTATINHGRATDKMLSFMFEKAFKYNL